MRTLILSGPPGAGKNTIARLLAHKLERCAVIDVDLLRAMEVQPHRAPREGEAGQAQQRLGAQNACLLARSFLTAGFAVVVLDALSEETAACYRTELLDCEPRIILLLPSLEEILRRNQGRGPRLALHEIVWLYDQQSSLQAFDEKIDNTRQPAEALAMRLAARFR